MASTDSCVVSAAAAFKHVYSGTGISSGPMLNFSNAVSLVDANVDGVYIGDFTYASTATTHRAIDLSSSTPLSVFSGLGGSTVVHESSFLGFTAPTDTTSRLIGYYLEVVSNSTGTDGKGAAGVLATLNGRNDTEIGSVGVVGDFIFTTAQTSSTAASVGSPKAGLLYLYTSGTATMRFKLVAFYRNTQYAT